MTALVEVFLCDAMEDRSAEEAGGCSIVRQVVEEEQEPSARRYEVVRCGPTSTLFLVTRSERCEPLGFRFHPEELDEMCGNAGPA